MQALRLRRRFTSRFLSPMGRIPLEDNFNDVIAKAQRGLGIDDADLARRAQVTTADIAALKAGHFDEFAARRIASHLRLNRDALVRLAQKKWYPQQPIFPSGFMAFNTPFEDMTVNSYVIWDERSKHAAVFDTGASCEPMLEFINSERLTVRYIFITHTHDDHIADLPRLVTETKGEVWASSREPAAFPGAKTFEENAFFHVGPISVKTLFTWGHSSGGTTFYITGLSWPVAVTGDSIFASSMGGGMVSYADAYENNLKKIMTLPNDTVLACGHGPLTTVAQERRNNPFFVR
jgi:glyoxylase-like metal-dependent hydrolase (beta-lactamase superfamily II)